MIEHEHRAEFDRPKAELQTKQSARLSHHPNEAAVAVVRKSGPRKKIGRVVEAGEFD